LEKAAIIFGGKSSIFFFASGERVAAMEPPPLDPLQESDASPERHSTSRLLGGRSMHLSIGKGTDVQLTGATD